MATPPRISFPRPALDDLCRKYGVNRLSLFGSFLRSDFRPDSDIDVLVEFGAGVRTGLRLVALEQELSNLVGGRRVDLRTPAELSRYFRDDVLKHCVRAYEQPG